MTRRTIGLLITLVLSFSWSWLTAAAPPGQMPRVGVLAPGSPPAAPDWKARSPFVQELRTLGWMEGQNLVLEYRWAEGQPQRLAPLAAELVRLPVDVIVTGDTAAIRAVTHATTTVPIVMVSVEDPLEWGAVATLARPGGNVTGVGGLVLESSSKLLELLTEAVPGVTRMAVVPGGGPRTIQEMEHAAQRIGVHTSLLPMRYPEQFEPAFQEAIRAGAGALIILPNRFYAQHLSRIAALALEYKLPAIFWQQRFAEVGGLMAYGPSWPHLWRRAAAQVDKILKGTKPADLPIEQPTTFELVINLKTAQALGLTMPPTLLFQATRLIR
jgi:putative tryptophan/tyrosine transport system substrate-binding protein